MPLVTILDINNTFPCVFCKSPVLDEVNWGPMYTAEDVACHYYCMLFSAGLHQKGVDDDGILGFLPADIWKEVRRSTRLKCSFCHLYGASIGCCTRSCKQVFHFPCALKNSVQFLFVKNYQAYCSSHHTPQEILVEGLDWDCPICLTAVAKDEEPVLATCCKGAVFHKECLKRTALNAGYFFKCPMCNATKQFIQDMRSMGIFVPEQDASWEREPNAFQDLLFQYSQCDAVVCECPKGKDHNASKGGFMLARCRVCGAAGVHRQCGKLKTVAKWACGECLAVEEKTKAEKAEKIKMLPFTSTSSSTSDPLPSSRRKTGKKPKQPPRKQFNVGDSDDDVDFGKLKIGPTSAAYFPFDRKQMKDFQKRTPPVIPDWRGFVLRANVVDWLGSYMRNIVGLNIPPPSGMLKTPTKKEQLASDIPPVSVFEIAEKSSFQVEEQTVILAPAKKSKRRRKGGRSSNWRRGVVRKRKAKNAKLEETVTSQSLSTGATELQDYDHELTPMSLVLSADNIGTNENASTGFPNSPAAKRRKVVELGHQIFAFGHSRDLDVQSNVEIGNQVALPTKIGNCDIDMSSLRFLKESDLGVSAEETPHDSQSSCGQQQIEDMKNGNAVDVQQELLEVWMEHSYFTRMVEVAVARKDILSNGKKPGIALDAILEGHESTGGGAYLTRRRGMK